MAFWQKPESMQTEQVAEINSAEERFHQERVEDILASAEPERRELVREAIERWVIEPLISNGEKRWLPRPLWDNEAILARNSFSSYEEALAEVRAKGGKLLDEDNPLSSGAPEH